ncbi:response regulator transcription factor [Dehalogenimonas etheniformans]|uniref:DNA-binding response regulator n=1 Tax=Dehalogenimonas etheniformans TaxID=1536648 RepID=A0A2P5P8Q0_9CHLR|nr:response regulator transcription factor [Dehalogenimonas etheniformans]PPD58671.1 DNA-binding response regulator [Dehalogenimonas etheniformans]QNT76558.1 response regulator transcription factor [Dehalogenimonas etheniformans]
MNILIIEDDKNIADTISLTLLIRWPEADIEKTYIGKDGINAVKEQSPDLVILDLGLPDMNGFDVLKEIRNYSNSAVVVLSVHREDNDIITALELGADDYITKPYKQWDLLSRVKAVVRRRELNSSEIDLTRKQYRLDSHKRILFVGNKVYTLTHNENIILKQMMVGNGRTVTNAALINALWGSNYPNALETLRVFICRLRNKIEADPREPKILCTKVGQGYFLGFD